MSITLWYLELYRAMRGTRWLRRVKNLLRRRPRFHPWVALRRKWQCTQYCCLENSMTGKPVGATVYGVAKGWTSGWTITTCAQAIYRFLTVSDISQACLTLFKKLTLYVLQIGYGKICTWTRNDCFQHMTHFLWEERKLKYRICY